MADMENVNVYGIKKNKKYKIKKAVISLFVASAVIVTSGAAGFFAMIFKDASVYKSTASTYSDSSSYTETTSNKNYDLKTNSEVGNDIPDNYTINYFNGYNILDTINKNDIEFSYSDLYLLDDALQIYKNTKTDNIKSYDVVTNGKIDANKLFNVIKENNYNYFNKDDGHYVSSLNYEIDDSTIMEVCNCIVSVYDTKKDDFNVNDIAKIVSHLKVVERPSSTAFAYVNRDLTLAINTNQVDMYQKLDKMKHEDDNIGKFKKTLIHEIEHLFQYASSFDLNEENGYEVGFSRNYNEAKVNSLWFSWIFEGTAEESMTNYLKTEPMNYAKRISYLKTYNLSRILDPSYSPYDIESSSYVGDLESMYKMLNLNTKEEQFKFLYFAYSTEIALAPCDDFWQYYESKTNTTLTEDDKEEIKFKLRAEALNYLSKIYYSNLSNAINSGKITDLNTAFYFLRAWEIDIYNHVQYNNEKSYNASDEFLSWCYDIEQEFLFSLSKATNLSLDEINDKYDEYRIFTNDKKNCSLDFLSDDKKKYLESFEKTFTKANYIRFSNINNYDKKEIKN